MPHRNRVAGQPRFRDGREHAKLLMAHVDEFHRTVAPQCVDHRVQRVADDPVTSPHPADASISLKPSATVLAICIPPGRMEPAF